MENSKIIGITIVIGLLVALGFTIVYTNKVSGATGAVAGASGMSAEGFDSYEEMMAAHHSGQAASQGAGASGMSNDGFDSYDEMMAAHHPGQAASSQNDGCGGVASGAGAKAEFAGTQSAYGITYDDAGYQELLKDADAVKLTAEQTKLIVGLNIQMPCCGVTTLQASDNCECGHHVALFGLAKRLASNGYSREQIQSEIDKWKEVFYPDGGSGNTGGC